MSGVVGCWGWSTTGRVEEQGQYLKAKKSRGQYLHVPVYIYESSQPLTFGLVFPYQLDRHAIQPDVDTGSFPPIDSVSSKESALTGTYSSAPQIQTHK